MEPRIAPHNDGNISKFRIDQRRNSMTSTSHQIHPASPHYWPYILSSLLFSSFIANSHPPSTPHHYFYTLSYYLYTTAMMDGPQWVSFHIRDHLESGDILVQNTVIEGYCISASHAHFQFLYRTNIT